MNGYSKLFKVFLLVTFIFVGSCSCDALGEAMVSGTVNDNKALHFRIYDYSLSRIAQRCTFKISFAPLKEEYYQMPEFLQMDHYYRCLSQHGAVLCVGTFELLPQDSPVYRTVQKVSSSFLHFNHSRFYRATCLGPHTSCPATTASNKSHVAAFEACVQKDILNQYGLESRLLELMSCKKHGEKTEWDSYDWSFAGYVAGIVALNVVATMYDCLLKDRSKGNRWLLCFSVKFNMGRMQSPPGDPRYRRFSGFNGIRGILATLVILAHCAISHVISSANPRDMELIMLSPEMGLMANGTVVVQAFLVISSMLHAFKIMVDAEKKPPGVLTVLDAVADRYIRLVPAFLTVVGYTATLAVHTGNGAMWPRLMEREAARCRETWWRQALLVQNWQPPVCVPQAWYLSVEFQLYVLATIIMVALVRRGVAQTARVLQILLAASVALLFAVVFALGLRASILANTLEAILHLYERDKSFLYLYQSLWGSAPTVLIGLLAAHYYYQARKNNVDYRNSKWLKKGFVLFPVVHILYCVLSCRTIAEMQSEFLISLHATLEKPVFSAFLLFLLFGCLFEVDHWLRRFLEWRGLAPLSRLSLCMLLVHGAVCKLGAITNIYPITYTRLSLISNWLSVTIQTILVSLPLHVMVEMPFLALYKTFTTTAQNEPSKMELNNNAEHEKEKTR